MVTQEEPDHHRGIVDVVDHDGALGGVPVLGGESVRVMLERRSDDGSSGSMSASCPGAKWSLVV